MTRPPRRPASDAGSGTFHAIERVNRSEQVRSQLERAIRRGDYAPGDRLPSERELGELFGVSRVSVREAISALEAVGLVDVQQGRGSFVAGPRADTYADSFGRWVEAHRTEVMELLDVRGALDELAAGFAAANASAADIETIRRTQDAFAAAIDDPGIDIDRLEQLDIAFHESVAAAGKNSLLADLLHDLNHHLSTSRRAVLALGARRPKAAAEHLRILEAIETHRPDLARARARHHIRAARRVLERLSQDHDAGPVTADRVRTDGGR